MAEFSQVIGLCVEDNQVVLLPRPEHLNHVQTIQAGVLYNLAEASSGHFLIQRLPELKQSHIAVLRSSSSKYRRPATLDGQLRCVADASDDAINAFIAKLTARGRAGIDVTASVFQNDQEIYQGSFGWFCAATTS